MVLDSSPFPMNIILNDEAALNFSFFPYNLIMPILYSSSASLIKFSSFIICQSPPINKFIFYFACLIAPSFVLSSFSREYSVLFSIYEALFLQKLTFYFILAIFQVNIYLLANFKSS